MNLLVVVPARGGSKGLPGKNLKRVGGISLVGRSVRIGVAAAAVWATKGPAFAAKVVVDTDDEAIAEEGRVWGAEVPFLRDAALAGDTVAMFDNVDAAVRRWADRGFAADAVLLLQPTSPLRSLDDVLGCLSVFESQPTSVQAVVACEHPPEQTLRLGGGGVLTVAFGEENATRRRQDYQAGYRSSGSAYVTSVSSLRASRSFLVPGETRGVVVARERAIDVDDRADLELARALHAQRAIAAPPWPATDTPGFVLNDAGDALLPAPGDPPLNVGNAAHGPVRIAAADAGLVDELRTIEAMAPAFVVAPHLTAFFALREAADVAVVLSSSSLVEHAVALSQGARGFVAPTALHAAIHEVVPFVRPSSGLPTAHRRLAGSSLPMAALPDSPAEPATRTLASRIIPRLDIKAPNLVKGIHLEGLRVMGAPADFAARYYQEGADELLYLDVVASLYGRNGLLDLVERTAREIFVPLTVAGGVRSTADVHALLRAGADKVAINTAAVQRPELLREASHVFGSQCIVLSIEAKRMAPGKWEVYTDSGRERTRLDVVEWAKKAVDLGVGEILLTSVDQDGTRRGFDLDLIAAIGPHVHVPVIASGGAGTPEHVAEALRAGADGVSLGTMLHFQLASIGAIKEHLRAAGEVVVL